jgi:predicted dehydrogenase
MLLLRTMAALSQRKGIRMEKVRIGVVGCGAIAEGLHMPGIKAIEEMGKCDIVAVCDVVEERAKYIRDKFGVPACYADLGKMLAEADFDLLVNLTRIPEHFAVSLQGLRAGRHVYTQKPMTTLVDEASILIDLAKQRNLLLASAPEHRVRKLICTIRDLVQGGAIGKVAFARVQASHDGPEKHNVPRDSTWYYKPGSDPILDIGVHGLAQITSILGPVKALSCFSGRSLPVRYITAGPFAGKRIDVEIDDNSMLMLDFGDATFSFLDATYCVEASRGSRLQIFGSEGTISLGGDRGRTLLELFETKTAEWTEVPLEPEAPTRDLGVLHVVDCLREGKPLLLTGEHGRHLVEIMTRAAESAKSGCTVQMATTF